jgi:hypothetical protein
MHGEFSSEKYERKGQLGQPKRILKIILKFIRVGHKDEN